MELFSIILVLEGIASFLFGAMVFMSPKEMTQLYLGSECTAELCITLFFLVRCCAVMIIGYGLFNLAAVYTDKRITKGIVIAVDCCLALIMVVTRVIHNNGHPDFWDLLFFSAGVGYMIIVLIILQKKDEKDEKKDKKE
jgi:hypothetical protein